MSPASLQLPPILTAVLLVVGLGAGVFAFSPALARVLLFMPPGVDPGPPPVLLGVAGEEVELETTDGVRVHGWWYRAMHQEDDGRALPPAVLVLHGNASSISAWAPSTQDYLERGISVLLLSYRGYGRSGGRPTLEGVPKDARAGVDFLAERAGGADRVVVHGRSLGGNVALSMLSLEGPAPGGFILESSFTSLDRIARAVYPFLPGFLLRRLRGPLNALENLSRYEGPVFVIHGTDDRIIPEAMGEALHRSALDSRGFWRVEGAGHNDLAFVAGPEYGERLAQFVHAVTRASPGSP